MRAMARCAFLQVVYVACKLYALRKQAPEQ